MLDYKYLCTKISDMAGLPIRVYKNKKMIYSYCFVSLVKDPISLCLKDILNKNESIDYYVNDNADYYGILNTKDLKIVIGPSLNPTTTEQQLIKLAFNLNVEPDKISDYLNALKSLVRMPLNSILQILCTLNYVFNKEKTNINELKGHDDVYYLPDNKLSEADVYRSINVEKTVCNFIENGDLNGFDLWAKQAPTIKEGKVADNYLRQNKNIFIVSTTIFSRAAIKAGLNPEKALNISDGFIQKCESLNSLNEISTLQVKMIRKYIEEINALLKATNNNPLAKQIYNLVKDNLSSNNDIETLANQLGYSRSYLSTIFKKENGISIKEYIQNIKIEEAKTLLIDSKNTLAAIAYYLGYSSSSHFSNSFKKATGQTPKAYQKNNNQ